MEKINDEVGKVSPAVAQYGQQLFYRDEQLAKIYYEYINTIKPLIALIEAEAKKFPISVFNEIRAVYDHIIRCYKDNVSNVDVDEHIEKIKGHHKRAILDCYKEIVLIYDDKISLFKKEHRHYNLGLIDNGDFLLKLNKGFQDAKTITKDAKIAEGRHDPSEDVITLYKQAIDKYIETLELIEEVKKHNKLKWVVTSYRKSLMLRITLWVVSAILSGIIGALIALPIQ